MKLGMLKLPRLLDFSDVETLREVIYCIMYTCEYIWPVFGYLKYIYSVYKKLKGGSVRLALLVVSCKSWETRKVVEPLRLIFDMSLLPIARSLVVGSIMHMDSYRIL